MRTLAYVAAVSTLKAPGRRNVALRARVDDFPTADLFAVTQDNLPSVDEALKNADAYEGNAIVDPYYVHPDTLPMMHEWTAETFDADLEAGGHAEWEIPTAAFVFLRTVTDPALRRQKHEDHLVWVRESNLRADKDDSLPRVYASQLLRDDQGTEIAGSLLAVIGGDEASAKALVASDPLARSLDEAVQAYHWTIAADPYLQLEVWPEGCAPFAMLRLDDAQGTSGRGATREKHLSFLRKTRRCVRAGPLRPLDGSSTAAAERAPCGSLVYSFHESEASCLAWAARDPYVDAGVFTEPPALLASYCDLDCSGKQVTRPAPFNELPDPVLARLVDAGLEELPERVIQRIERDPQTGKYERYNVTTRDPRLESNVRIDDELMAVMASTPKAKRAKRAKDKKAKEDAEADEEFGPGGWQ